MRRKKRALIYFVISFLVVVFGTGAVLASEKSDEVPDTVRAHRAQQSDDGHFERGGKAIGRNYGHGGKEFGQGTAGFATSLVKGKFGEAGRSMGQGSAEFGKGIGRGTASGFKQFGQAFVNWGKKIDRSASDGQS